MTRLGAFAFVSGLLMLPASATPRAQDGAARTTVGHVLKPVELPPPDPGAIKVPDGFRVRRFAEGLGKPRMLAVAGDALYVTRRDVGDVVLLRDADRDGRADAPVVVARRPQLHGIAFAGDHAFLVTVKEIFSASRLSDGRLGPLTRLVDDLPDGGQHPNRTIVPGPDGLLYVTVGSTCNACDETHPESATIVRLRPDGQGRRIYASGLRNTIGLGFRPGTSELWGMDHGIDWLGDDDQPEELNRLELDQQYGWPYIYAHNKENPQDEPPGKISKAQWARMSRPPVLTYTPHAAPMQLAFYAADRFPPRYRGGAFVAMHGSWNRQPPSGYEVAYIRFENGTPVAIEPFATGFLVAQAKGSWAMNGRPVGVAVSPSGELLVSDDLNGVIYAISYEAPRGPKS
jgi:glucose/arabinose dehydrogenase